jgi:hypothetical protein
MILITHPFIIISFRLFIAAKPTDLMVIGVLISFGFYRA